jgi:hypothetical protein
MNSPSRFLEDIPDNLVTRNSYRETQQKEFEKLFANKKTVPRSTLHVVRFKGGEKVKHAEFGEGIVVSAVDDTVTVAFKKAGIKRLSAEFAKLKVI